MSEHEKRARDFRRNLHTQTPKMNPRMFIPDKNFWNNKNNTSRVDVTYTNQIGFDESNRAR